MTEQHEQYARYARDSAVLESIGRALAGQVSPVLTLPEPLPAVETDRQRRLREDAGMLALIGLTVVRAEQSGGELVLTPDLVAGAVRAAERRPR